MKMKTDAFSLKDIVEGIESFPNITFAGRVDCTNIFDEERGIFYNQHYIMVAPSIPVYSTPGLNRILLQLETELGPDRITPCAIRGGHLVYGSLHFTTQPDKEVEHYEYGIVTLIPNATLGINVQRRVREGWWRDLNELDMKKLRRMKLRDRALRRN